MKNSSLNGVGVKHLHIMDDMSVCIWYFFLWDTTSGTYYMIQFWVGFEVMYTELSSYQVILLFHTCKLFCLVLNMHRQGCVVFKYLNSRIPSVLISPTDNVFHVSPHVDLSWPDLEIFLKVPFKRRFGIISGSTFPLLQQSLVLLKPVLTGFVWFPV